MLLSIKPGYLFLLIMSFLPLVACDQLGIFPTATPLPLPTELSTTSLPSGSQPGNLEAIYVSLASIDGGQGSRCHTLYRFYPDGLALYAKNSCFDTPPSDESRAEIEEWFHRENHDLDRGDYFLIDHGVFIRIVSYNDVFETTSLSSFQGEYCNEKMVLQEPLVRGYSGIPSELTQPVLEYALLETRGRPDGGRPGTAGQGAGFKILYRPSVAVAGNQAEYQVQTDPGETCVLVYTAPDGSPGPAMGTGEVVADDQGICTWTWEVGDLEGQGTVTVRIDQITQDFGIEVR